MRTDSMWRLRTVLLAGCLALAAGRAEAQWGYGGGFYNFNYQPPEVGFLNQRSLLNASRATMGPVQNNAYAGNPNAYVNHLHDEGYLEKYSVATLRSMEEGVARHPDYGPPTPAPSATAAQAPPPSSRPMLPLSSFFDRYQKLVWPDESPTYGQLGAKRGISDQACLAVFNEYNLRGLASLSTVTDARSKLIAYGQPALQYVRDNATPRIADTFHLFLMSLYESLAQAATIPKPAAAPSAP